MNPLEGVEEEWILQSALHVAAYSGDVDRLQELLQTCGVDDVEEYRRTALMYAAMADRWECVQLLLKHSALISARDNNGQTALHWAAATDSYKSLKLLLAQAPDITIADNDGRTALHLATSHPGSKCLAAIVRRLKPHNLNQPDNEKMTALHWSAYNNTPDNVRLLLKAGADIVLTDRDGKTTLHWTANNQDDSTVKTLLELAPTVVNLRDSEGRTALHLAVAAGNVPVVEALTSTAGVRCDVSAVDLQFRTPLHWGAVLGLAELVTLLLQSGASAASTDAVGATPLHYAAQKNHVECVAALLAFPGAQDLPDSEGRTALMWAAQRGNYHVLKTMLERGVALQTADSLGATALHAAALSGHSSCVQLLLQHGAGVDVVDSSGHTPLFRACERGHTEAVVLLLNAGASALLVDASGRSCLHWAASGGHSVICSSLLQQSLPVNVADSGGRTALHCAAYGGFTECMASLLEAGAVVSLQDSEGITALHWACSAGHSDATQLLLGVGANFNVMEVDGDRLTPLDYAMIGDHQEIAQLLIEAGALSISGIQELAAAVMQKCVRGFLARRRVQRMAAERGVGRPHPPPTVEPASQPLTTQQEDPSVEQERSLERRRELEERLLEAGQQLQKLHSWSSSRLKGVHSELALREKERVGLYRQKTKAALVIQLAWRRYVRRLRHRQAMEAQSRALQRGSLEWRQELAALIIQLAWRQYQRRKILHMSIRRQRVLHEWSPSILASRQRALADKVYGQELSAVHYEPPKAKPMVRPAYFHYIPSPAALSFNFAVQQYQPQHTSSSERLGYSSAPLTETY